jgi:hypothetical protein
MGFWGVIGDGWRGAFGAIRQNILLFAAAVAGGGLVQGAAYFVAPLHYAQHLSPTMHPHMYITGSATYLLVRNTAVDILNCTAMAPMMVAIHRFVLLRDTQNIWLNWRRVALFATFLAGIHFGLMELPGYFQQLYPAAGVITIGGLWLLGRLVLTYPATALDMAEPWLESWRRTRGHWWFIAGVMVISTLPLYLIILPIFFSTIYNATPATVGVGYMKETIVTIMATPFWYVFVAALASELFRKFGGVPAQS